MMLELRDIYKTYTQGKLEVPVLGGISLSVDEGEYVAIMGPSGSGKTTLMNIIGCLDNPTSGAYLLEGEDIAGVSEKRMSEVRLHSIGFVFQSFYLLSRQSALENVALPLLYAGVRKKERQEIARRALERVGLGDRTDFKPTQLSGGQCQRVAIARAIVNSPKILLADEPTGALDTRSGQQIMEIFQSLNQEGVTIVMITHEPEIAAHAKRTLHIRDGLLVNGTGRLGQRPPVPGEAAPAEKNPVEKRQNPAPQKPGNEPARRESADKNRENPPVKREERAYAKLGPAKPANPGTPRSAKQEPAYAKLQEPRRAPSPDQPGEKRSGPPSGAAGRINGKAETGKTPPPKKAEASNPKAPVPEKAEPAAPEAANPDEQPISGQSIIAALERQLEQLKQSEEQEGGGLHED